MSKHWKPDGDAIPLRASLRSGRTRRGWTSLADYAPPRPRPRAHEMRPATIFGLALVVATCLAAAIGAATVFAPPNAVDRAVLTE